MIIAFSRPVAYLVLRRHKVWMLKRHRDSWSDETKIIGVSWPEGLAVWWRSWIGNPANDV